MNVTVNDLMRFIPEEMLEELASETKVDKINTYKLKGKDLFQILLYSILEENKISLRMIEDVFGRHSFNFFYKNQALKVSKSGLSDRLKIIPYEFFERIFGKLSANVSDIIPNDKKQEIIRFDSTILTLSSKLLKCGYPVANGPKNQIKFSVGFNGIPVHCTISGDKGSMSEDVALKNAILSSSISQEDIAVFDRGLSSRKTFKQFSQQQISFVTRLNDRANYRVLEVHQDVLGHETQTLILQEDVIVNLRSKHTHWIDEKFRLIRALHKETNKQYIFLTNLFDLSAEEITEIYRRRWDIEVFFKFIKQYLSTKHFLSRNLNGIKVVFYMILILSILMLAFKILNKIDGLMMATLKFKEQFRRLISYQMVLFYRQYPGELEGDLLC